MSFLESCNKASWFLFLSSDPYKRGGGGVGMFSGPLCISFLSQVLMSSRVLEMCSKGYTRCNSFPPVLWTISFSNLPFYMNLAIIISVRYNK